VNGEGSSDSLIQLDTSHRLTKFLRNLQEIDTSIDPGFDETGYLLFDHKSLIVAQRPTVADSTRRILLILINTDERIDVNCSPIPKVGGSMI
jgi:hypothetical protein